MRWFARPENNVQQLRVTPELDCWEGKGHPEAVRLQAYLDDTVALVAGSKVQGPWALRLDVGRPADRDLLDKADLDNYAFPLATRLRDANLVSVWCTKAHRAQSYVCLEAAREVPGPRPEKVLLVETTASWQSALGGDGSAAQRQLIDAVAHATALPPGLPVRLELSFVVGPGRNWLKLWKPAIDSLDSILGRTYPDRPRNPLDGRITELGLHVTIDPGAGNKVVIGIDATAGSVRVSPRNRIELDHSANVDQRSGRHHIPNDSASVDDSSQVAESRPFVRAATDERPAGDKALALGSEAREFRNDDAGYLSWLAEHPEGYVINIGRGHSPAGARLHRTRCKHLNRPSRGVWTEGDYVKVCAPRLTDLDQWTLEVVRASIEPCPACKPV